MFVFVKDKLQHKVPKGTKRSPKWRKVRNEHVRLFPSCQLCGSRKKLEVHHIIPFHMRPDLELHPDNRMTLCERKKYGITCHQFFGHLGNYRKYNPHVVKDVEIWRWKLEHS